MLNVDFSFLDLFLILTILYSQQCIGELWGPLEIWKQRLFREMESALKFWSQPGLFWRQQMCQYRSVDKLKRREKKTKRQLSNNTLELRKYHFFLLVVRFCACPTLNQPLTNGYYTKHEFRRRHTRSGSCFNEHSWSNCFHRCYFWYSPTKNWR